MRTPVRLSKLRPLVDVVFRRLFDKPKLLCSLLNAVLGHTGDELLVELTIQPVHIAGILANDKEVVLDIRAVARSGRHYHIEVQVRTFTAYVERMLYYSCGIYHGQLRKGQTYQALRQVVSVHLLGHVFLPEEEQFAHWHHVFQLRERRTGFLLTDHLEMHTLEMPKFLLRLEDLSTDESKWVYYLLYGHEMTAEQIKGLGVTEIEEADKELEMLSQDRELRVLYEMRLRAALDAASWEKDHIEHWMDKGKKLGLDEGLEKGKKLGLDEGKKLGLDEGKKLGQVEAILKVLHARGFTLSEEVAGRILACQDAEQLTRWLLRATTLTGIDDLFAP